MSERTSIARGAIAWMAGNPVAANLVMLFLVVGGLAMAFQVKQEVFPEINLDIVMVTVVYPGASPEEIEQGTLLAIEESVRGLDGIKKVTAVARENSGVVSVELLLGAKPDRALADIKNAVDRITSFPQDAERPIVSLISNRREVISLVVYGNADEHALLDRAERVREDLLKDDRITQVDVTGLRDLEVSVEVPKDELRAYNLSLEQIAGKIRQSSVEIGGGGIKTSSGEVLLKTDERRTTGRGFEDIALMSSPDGATLHVGDIAEVIDGFADTDQTARFRGRRAAMVKVYRVGDETPIEVAAAVKEYQKKTEANLPPGLKYSVWRDWSEIYRDRISLLLRNAFYGLVLVFGVLALFLEIRLAFWVTLGIPISFLGSLLFMPAMDASINMISLFAFIVTLGMVVDDAIVIGENIYSERQAGASLLKAAVTGARGVATPVIFAVLTTVVAFMPLFFVPGVMGKFFWVIPAIVISVLTISLIESTLILPAHLSHGTDGLVSKAIDDVLHWGPIGVLHRGQRRFSNWFERFVVSVYMPQVRMAVSYRYLTVAAAIGFLVATVGLVVGGRVDFSFFPKLDSDVVKATVMLPHGAPIEETQAVEDRIIKAAHELIDENGGDAIVRGFYAQTGGTTADIHSAGATGASSSNLAEVSIFFVPTDQRNISAKDFTQKWRERLGEVAGVESLTFKYNAGPSAGTPIDIQLSHTDVAVLQKAAAEVAAALPAYAGVKDVEDGFAAGKPQLNFTLRPEARSAGLTELDVARQVRGAFFGIEAVRQQRGRHEVRTYVRLPKDERILERTIEDMMLRTPNGGEIPLAVAANVRRDRAPSEITRVDGRRVVHVTADIEEGRANADNVLKSVTADVLPGVLSKYPGVTVSLEGEQREKRESMQALLIGFLLALGGIYALLAIPFKSYLQPIIVMSAIPFGFIGAVAGHMLLGYELSLMSLMGIVALAGIVVNDSLVLVVKVNEEREEGKAIQEAIVHGAASRFRPILLTSLTTFLGLAPMVFETSVQARFLIPMALSLAFGVLFSTLITLGLVPAGYAILEDIQRAGTAVARFLFDGPPSSPDQLTEESTEGAEGAQSSRM